jgi:hypothetical protein
MLIFDYKPKSGKPSLSWQGDFAVAAPPVALLIIAVMCRAYCVLFSVGRISSERAGFVIFVCVETLSIMALVSSLAGSLERRWPIVVGGLVVNVGAIVLMVMAIVTHKLG